MPFAILLLVGHNWYNSESVAESIHILSCHISNVVNLKNQNILKFHQRCTIAPWSQNIFKIFSTMLMESDTPISNLVWPAWIRSDPHLALTENGLKFFVPTDPTNNYENTYIWWYEIIKINLFSQALFEKTHISVILYYKIDHFCPLKSNFHTFPTIWPNVWVWNLLLLSYYHLLVQVRHARSLFFPFWHQ